MTENVRNKALCLHFVHEEAVVVNPTGDHGVYNGQTVECHQVSHACTIRCNTEETDKTVSDHRHCIGLFVPPYKVANSHDQSQST